MDKRTEARTQPIAADQNAGDAARPAANRWAWLPSMMPGVARLMAEKRREWGSEHVAECWRRGVLQQQPDWFFAREGAIAIGTPFSDELIRDFGAMRTPPGAGMLQMARPGGQGKATAE